MAGASGRVRIDDRQDGVRVLTLDSPARRNALTESMLEALDRALDTTPAAFLVRGEGPAFCAGYDLTELKAGDADGALPDTRLLSVLRRLQEHPAPSVACVHGVAIGAGCDLACACDFRVGAPDALFWMPPARLGVVYAEEGLARVTRLAGLARAKTMFLLARKIDAPRALEWGLLDELHPAESVHAAAEAVCRELAEGAPLAVRGMKQGLEQLAGGPLTDARRSAFEALRREAYRSADVAEGRAAFLEKRPPKFRGA